MDTEALPTCALTRFGGLTLALQRMNAGRRGWFQQRLDMLLLQSPKALNRCERD